MVVITVPGSLIDGGAVLIDPASAGESDGRPRMVIRAVTDARGRPLAAEEGPGGTVRYRVHGPAVTGTPTTDLRISFRVPYDRSGFDQVGYYLFSAHRAGTRWYPEVVAAGGEPVRFADFKVRLRWPDSAAVLTTGRRQDEARVGRHHRVALFEAEHAEGFALAVAPGYERVVIEDDHVELEFIASPAELETFATVGRRAVEAAAFFHSLYGFFPNGRLGILPGVPNYSGGFPMPGVFMIHRGNLEGDYVRFITAHEIGHYYWGLHVLDHGERLGWLMLANGIIADQLYLARHHGRTLEEQWRVRGQGDWMQDFLEAHVAGWEQRLGIERPDADGLNFDYNSLIRHGKGATGLYLQVRRLGVDRFAALQRELLNEFAHRPLDSHTFIERLEAAGATGAGNFFRQWERGDASIAWHIAAIDSAEDGAGRVVRFRKTGTVDYPVDVIVEFGKEGRRQAVLGPGDAQDSVHVPAAGDLRIRLDPDGALPIWNSDHPQIQRLFIHALYQAGLRAPFVPLAEAFLSEHEDPLMKQRLERVRGLGGSP